jgi:hypothetical protein
MVKLVTRNGCRSASARNGGGISSGGVGAEIILQLEYLDTLTCDDCRALRVIFSLQLGNRDKKSPEVDGCDS